MAHARNTRRGTSVQKSSIFMGTHMNDCYRGGQIMGLVTKIPQRGTWMEPGGDLAGAKPPEADDRL